MHHTQLKTCTCSMKTPHNAKILTYGLIKPARMVLVCKSAITFFPGEGPCQNASIFHFSREIRQGAKFGVKATFWSRSGPLKSKNTVESTLLSTFRKCSQPSLFCSQVLSTFFESTLITQKNFRGSATFHFCYKLLLLWGGVCYQTRSASIATAL